MSSIGIRPNQLPTNGMLGTLAFQDAAAVNIEAGIIGTKSVAELNSAASDAREWTAVTIPQAEAEQGTATTRRAWNALRVFQAIAAWWAGSEAKQKLDNIAAEATKNESDEHLLDRANHTGTQAISTVDGLQGQLDAKAPASALAAKQDLSTVIAKTATAQTSLLADAGQYLRFTNASASTYTVAPQASVAWPDNAEITIRRAAAGNLTLTPGSGVALNAPSGGTLVLTNNMTVTLKKVATDVWDVIGQTVAA